MNQEHKPAKSKCLNIKPISWFSSSITKTSTAAYSNCTYGIEYSNCTYGMSWGTASKSRLETVQVKQNKCIRSIFFARNRESPHIYYKLLEILKLKNIFNLKICILVYRIKYIKTKIPSAFLDLIPSVSEIHCYNTRYSANHNLYRPSSRTNYGLSRFKAISSRTWEKIPLNIKQLSFNRFKSQYKLYLLDNQNWPVMYLYKY